MNFTTAGELTSIRTEGEGEMFAKCRTLCRHDPSDFPGNVQNNYGRN